MIFSHNLWSMNKLRLILIIWSIFSLIGIFRTINTRDNVSGRSSGSEQLFAKALQTIDSIFVADDDNPQRYEKFKKSTSSLRLYDMESECYRMAVSNDQRWKEEYYCRGIIERYRPEMPPSDKIRIIRVMNNMGCIYNEKNNPVAAYIFLKTGYEMAKKFYAINE